MPRKAKEMTALEVKSLNAPGLHFVGGVSGLALQVLPKGGRTWVLRFSLAGRRRDMGLGGFPDLPLKDAHAAARKARELIKAGIDPIEQAEAVRRANLAMQAATITFKEAAERYIAAKQPEWKSDKHAAQWIASLNRYVYPQIGALSVADVDLPQVLAILEPIWTTKTETATRVRGRVELILNWATSRGYRTGLNPARWRGHLDSQLAAPSKVAEVVNHPALPVSGIAEFMVSLRAAKGMGARALEFAILTATRSGETRGATWDEIDFDEGVWTIPKARMKGRKGTTAAHRVPLSSAALKVLREIPRIDGSELIFPAPRGGQLSDMTLSAVLRRMGVQAVPHGFRSTFRDWSAENTAYPNEVCEMALAHIIRGKAEAAYRRGDLLPKRRRMMEDWATFVGTVQPAGKVTPIRKAG